MLLTNNTQKLLTVYSCRSAELLQTDLCRLWFWIGVNV